MKNKQLRLRMSERRFNKLKQYAEYADKTMTQVIDELIDTLPNIKNGDSDARSRSVSQTRLANASPDGDATRTLSSTPCPVNPTD
jgi:hypothetical protein